MGYIAQRVTHRVQGGIATRLIRQLGNHLAVPVGSKITSDAGLLAHRELDEKLGLTEMAGQFLTE